MSTNEQVRYALQRVEIFGEDWLKEHDGAAPEAGQALPSRRYILQANSEVDRALLQAFVEKIDAERQAPASLNGAAGRSARRLSWFSVAPATEVISHEGLREQLEDDEGDPVIIPVGVLWVPKPNAKSGVRRLFDLFFEERRIRSERRQKQILETEPKRCVIVVGEPARQSALVKRHKRVAAVAGDFEQFADFVARQAALTVERGARQRSAGSLKYPRFVAEALWERAEFQKRLGELANELNRPLEDVQKEARACMDELIPRVKPFYVALFMGLLKFIRRLGYEEKIILDDEEVKKFRDLAMNKSMGLLFTHKSHIDGFVVGNATYDAGFPLVHMVGGNNMAFFGMGFLARRSGAIFIRRSTKDSHVYKAVLRFYLSYLLEKRFPIAWSLEGTRSRNGKLMPPRFGILKYVVEAASKNSITDLHITPITIYYDLIAELDDYAHEQTGGAKRPESLAWFAEYVSSLRKPLGRLSMRFGESVVVDASRDDFLVKKQCNHEAEDSFSLALQKIGFEASVHANAVTPITPSAVHALVLTGASPQALTESEFVQEFQDIIRWAVRRKIPLTAELQHGDIEKTRSIAEAMIKVGVAERHDEGLEPVFTVARDKHFAAAYYRNAIIHFFVNKSIAELALAKAGEADAGEALSVFYNEVMNLRDIFKYEFFYPEWEEQKAEIEEELARYDENWKDIIVAGGATKFLKKMTPLVSNAILRPFAEAYVVVSDVLLGLKAADDENEKAIVATAIRYGKQAYLRRQITSSESVGKLMFSNGYQLAKNRGLIGGRDIVGARVGFARELRDVARRIRLIDAICAQRRANHDFGVRGLVHDSDNERLDSDMPPPSRPQDQAQVSR